MKKIITLFVITLFLCSCSSVTLRTDDQRETHDTPSFQQRYTYWWWGLQGEHDVNVRIVCQDKGVEQIQTVNTVGDTLLQVITMGIYSPRTAKIWCKES